ncbi:MAG: hypothetical protein ACI4II_08555 [Acutalibacteraceae bacterium]
MNPNKNDDKIKGFHAMYMKVDPSQQVTADDDLNENKNKRSQLYSKILNDYADYLHDTFIAKRRYKLITYICVMSILVGITVVTIILFFMHSSFEMKEWLAVAIPLMISFLTVFIVIPQIITNYLFDKDEESHLTELIKILKDIDNPTDGVDKR